MRSESDLFVGALLERVGIHCELVGDTLLDSPVKSLRRKIASGIGLPLQSYQHFGKTGFESSLLKKIISLMKGPIFSSSDAHVFGTI